MGQNQNFTSCFIFQNHARYEETGISQILNFDFNKQAVELWNITCQPQQQPSFNQEV